MTASTTGYGDLAPTGFIGKLVASFLQLAGIIVLALPISIIGSNFTTVYREFEGLRGWAKLGYSRDQARQLVAAGHFPEDIQSQQMMGGMDDAGMQDPMATPFPDALLGGPYGAGPDHRLAYSGGFPPQQLWSPVSQPWAGGGAAEDDVRPELDDGEDSDGAISHASEVVGLDAGALGEGPNESGLETIQEGASAAGQGLAADPAEVGREASGGGRAGSFVGRTMTPGTDTADAGSTLVEDDENEDEDEDAASGDQDDDEAATGSEEGRAGDRPHRHSAFTGSRDSGASRDGVVSARMRRASGRPARLSKAPLVTADDSGPGSSGARWTPMAASEGGMPRRFDMLSGFAAPRAGPDAKFEGRSPPPPPAGPSPRVGSSFRSMVMEGGPTSRRRRSDASPHPESATVETLRAMLVAQQKQLTDMQRALALLTGASVRQAGRPRAGSRVAGTAKQAAAAELLTRGPGRVRPRRSSLPEPGDVEAWRRASGSDSLSAAGSPTGAATHRHSVSSQGAARKG